MDQFERDFPGNDNQTQNSQKIHKTDIPPKPTNSTLHFRTLIYEVLVRTSVIAFCSITMLVFDTAERWLGGSIYTVLSRAETLLPFLCDSVHLR